MAGLIDGLVRDSAGVTSPGNTVHSARDSWALPPEGDSCSSVLTKAKQGPTHTPQQGAARDGAGTSPQASSPGPWAAPPPWVKRPQLPASPTGGQRSPQSSPIPRGAWALSPRQMRTPFSITVCLPGKEKTSCLIKEPPSHTRLRDGQGLPAQGTCTQLDTQRESPLHQPSFLARTLPLPRSGRVALGR